MTLLVVDASVAIKWYVRQAGSEQAIRVLEDTAHALCAPDLLIADMGTILWQKRTRGELPAAVNDELAAILADPGRFPVRLIPSQPLVAAALALAQEFGRPVYDALYLAVALQDGAELVTADADLANAVAGSPFWRARTRLIA